MKQLPRRSGEVSRDRHAALRNPQYGYASKPLEDWGKLIGDVPSATAISGRFLHHAEVLSFSGKSYRLRSSDEASGAADEPSNAAIAPTGSEAIDAPPSNRSGRKNRKPEPDATC